MGQSMSQMTHPSRATSRFVNTPRAAAGPQPSLPSSFSSSSPSDTMGSSYSQASSDPKQPRRPFKKAIAKLQRLCSPKFKRDTSTSTSRRVTQPSVAPKEQPCASSSSSPSPAVTPSRATTSNSSGPSSSRFSPRSWPLSGMFHKSSSNTRRAREDSAREPTLPEPLSETPEVVIAEPSTTSANEAPPAPAPPAPPPPAPPAEPLPASLSEAPTATSTDTTAHATTATSTDAPVPPRTFPPAGTLVVVQGVVHTTDADLSRPVGDGIPSTATPAGSRASSVPRPARRGLSRRSRPSSRGGPAAPTDVEADLSESSTENSHSSASTDDANAAQRPTSSDQAAEANSRPTPLSPSSIDVLGTLLSVAAAATAASLVTGSSAPLLSSGLAHPGSSPQPGLSAEDTPLPSSRRDADAAHTSERRRPWTTLRDRMRPTRPTSQAGRANASPSPAPGGEGVEESGTEGPAEPRPNAVDARERMLQDMVRALNHGLGAAPAAGAQNGDSGVLGSGAPVVAPGPLSSQSLTVPRTGAAPEYPEGSFEQFLVNMQTDLRRTLRDGENGESTGQGMGAHPVDEDDLFRGLMGIAQREEVPEPQSDPELRTRSSQDAIADAFFPAPLHPPPRRHSVSRSSSVGRSEISRPRFFSVSEATPPPMQQLALPTEPNASGASNSSMPSLHNGSEGENTDSEEDHPPVAGLGLAREEQSPHDFFAIPSPHSVAEPASGLGLHEHGQPTFVSPTPPPGPAGGRNINWWRMYRFPPIATPQSANPPPPATAMPTATRPAEPSFPPSTGLPHASPLLQQQQQEMVVPVIVVGLQSVNLQHGGEDGAVPGMGEAPFGEGMGPGEEAPRRGRGRLTRATSVFRGLRPGRRNEQRQSEPTGARTFLIYVIGGYYPPNHRIVTGTGALDSFEALLELAEVLGQVKPPTVTTEEIDKAGLEVIDSSKLSEYEAAGKVASNCVDRCLICLDDYEKTDELRILGCKHTFHKECVDRWMSTGRNNCPACRSQGVPVTESSDESSSARLPTAG